MKDRECLNCGIDIENKKPGAKFCKDGCRVSYFSKQKRREAKNSENERIEAEQRSLQQKEKHAYEIEVRERIREQYAQELKNLKLFKRVSIMLSVAVVLLAVALVMCNVFLKAQ